MVHYVIIRDDFWPYRHYLSKVDGKHTSYAWAQRLDQAIRFETFEVALRFATAADEIVPLIQAVLEEEKERERKAKPLFLGPIRPVAVIKLK